MKIRRKLLSISLAFAILVSSAPATYQTQAAVKLTPKENVIEKGETLKLKLSGNKKTVKWSVSDESVIEIITGKKTYAKVKGISEGYAVVRAKISKKTYRCTVFVRDEETEETKTSTETPDNESKNTGTSSGSQSAGTSSGSSSTTGSSSGSTNVGNTSASSGNIGTGTSNGNTSTATPSTGSNASTGTSGNYTGTETTSSETTENYTNTETSPSGTTSSDDYTPSISSEESESTWVLNTNTMKFHKPSCKDVNNIKAENKQVVTALRSDVISQGYSPCGHCRP